MDYPKNIAIVCDWLTNMGGAEQVIKALHQKFPGAPIFTPLYNPTKVKGFESAEIRTSYLQKIPFAKSHHQLLINQMPLAIESFNLSAYDVVISSSHAVAKGVITKPSTLHISYCHTPMRYAWEHWEIEERLKLMPKALHSQIRKSLHTMRMWDKLTASRVDAFACNSSFVRERIKKYYRRDATVLHPPVNTNKFTIGQPKDYFLMVGRLIPYKKFDLVIETFNKTGRNLLISGTGPSYKSLKAIAKNNITFLGRTTDEELQKLYSECQALIFPQVEDFGIISVECMASGRPVIAYEKGGGMEIVEDGKTGLFFKNQTVESLSNALKAFPSHTWNPQEMKAAAERFSVQTFYRNLDDWIQTTREERNIGNTDGTAVRSQHIDAAAGIG